MQIRTFGVNADFAKKLTKTAWHPERLLRALKRVTVSTSESVPVWADGVTIFLTF